MCIFIRVKTCNSHIIRVTRQETTIMENVLIGPQKKKDIALSDCLPLTFERDTSQYSHKIILSLGLYLHASNCSRRAPEIQFNLLVSFEVFTIDEEY